MYFNEGWIVKIFMFVMSLVFYLFNLMDMVVNVELLKNWEILIMVLMFDKEMCFFLQVLCYGKLLGVCDV